MVSSNVNANFARATVTRDGTENVVRIPASLLELGDEIEVEKRGEEIILRRKTELPAFETIGDAMRLFQARFPDKTDWPEREPQPSSQI
ncbi:hypothetical protein DB346_08205 [Verrucomicrobia bacterium LW23]|nr:hypothetical protein DB346_08205 [Verrucomicrobia bacterium LW23]